MNTLTGSSTRDRLLGSAGEVFADKGFHGATVREIVHRAGANVAAINYHFGGKSEIYDAALVAAYERLAEAFAVPAEALVDAGPTVRLERFLHAFMARLMEQRPESWQFRLLAREMAPGGRCSPQALVAPVIRHLTRLAGDLEPGLSLEAAALAAHSILAQCFHFGQARPFLEIPTGEVGSALLVRHITQFTLGGLGRLHEGDPRT